MPKADWQKEMGDGMERGHGVLPKKRPVKCDVCGSTDIQTDFNVGWDVWPGGEETQHEDHCATCGASRLWSNVLDWEEGPSVAWGLFEKHTEWPC